MGTEPRIAGLKSATLTTELRLLLGRRSVTEWKKLFTVLRMFISVSSKVSAAAVQAKVRAKTSTAKVSFAPDALAVVRLLVNADLGMFHNIQLA